MSLNLRKVRLHLGDFKSGKTTIVGGMDPIPTGAEVRWMIVQAPSTNTSTVTLNANSSSSAEGITLAPGDVRNVPGFSGTMYVHGTDNDVVQYIYAS